MRAPTSSRHPVLGINRNREIQAPRKALKPPALQAHDSRLRAAPDRVHPRFRLTNTGVSGDHLTSSDHLSDHHVAPSTAHAKRFAASPCCKPLVACAH